MANYDALATTWVNSFSGSWRPLDLLLIAITTVGAPAMILSAALRWWSPIDRTRERHTAVAAGLSFIVGLTLNQILLLFAHRVRPYDAGVTHLLIAPSRDPSFPSDHATAAFSIVFAFMLQKRFLRAFLFSLVSSLLVLSRVYLGIHYVGDILGGMLTALIAASLVQLLYQEGTRFDRWITSILQQSDALVMSRPTDGVIDGKGHLYHRLFVVAVVLKGLNGLAELVAGASILAMGHAGLRGIVTLLTARELSEDPTDLVANLLRRWFAQLSADAEVFAAVYLLTHGIVKIVLATCLLREKSWAFPAAAAFFALFIAYMSYRLTLGWSWSIAALCLFDLVTLSLVLHEWRARSDPGRRTGSL